MYEHWRGAYDLRALGEAADFVRAVVYAQHTRRTPPGPSQNLPWLERVMKHFTQSIPPQKLVIGLGMGASHWFTVADPKLYYQGARSWSRGIRRAEVQSMLAQYNGPPLQWDDRQKMSFSYIERAGVFEWIVSDNDVRAFDAKLDLARRLGVRGVSMWVNGDEEPGMWSRFRARPLTKSRRAAVQPHGGIPVLAWHYFADSITPETGTLTDTFERFEEMLAWMKRQNFTSVFPDQARLPAPGGSRQVILTFDDGRKEQMRAAAMLERYGFRGIFFVIPSRTRDTSSVYLTRADIAELARAGHRIAVHGAEHRSQALSGAEAAASVADAYERLRESGTTPSAVEFAFPFGHYTPETARAVASRYRYLMTVNPGYWEQGATMVPRMLIFRDVDIGLYRDYLMGGSAHATTLEPLTADGVTSDTILLRTGGTRLPAGIEMLAVSADSTGRSYASHPIGDAMTLRGDTLVLDLR